MVDREIYKHLLVTDPTKNIRLYQSTRSYHMFIKPGDKENQISYFNDIIVALLENGDLVYVYTGSIFSDEISHPGLVCIGRGKIHHLEKA